MNLENGKVYNISHSRKGNFVMRCDSQNGEWTNGTIINGETEAMCSYNKAYEGESVTMRTSFIRAATEVVNENG